jgi:hypothetical protein
VRARPPGLHRMRIEAVPPRGIGYQLNGLPRACLVVLYGGSRCDSRAMSTGRHTKRKRRITREARRTTLSGIAAVLPSWSCRSHATNHEQHSHEVKQRSHSAVCPPCQLPLCSPGPAEECSLPPERVPRCPESRSSAICGLAQLAASRGTGDRQALWARTPTSWSPPSKVRLHPPVGRPLRGYSASRLRSINHACGHVVACAP